MSTSPTPRRRRRQRNEPPPPTTEEPIQPISPEPAASAAVSNPPSWSPFRARIGSLLHDQMRARVLLLFAVAFNLYVLWPEVAIRVPPPNDGVLHLQVLRRTLGAFALGQNVSDHWLPSIGMGYPLFHYYQQLAYIPPALAEWLLVRVLRVAPAMSDLFDWTRYLLLSLFPLSIYWSLRRLSFERAPAVLAALVSSLLATNGLYGFDFGSYVWRGYGLYTQLWGMLLLPPTIAQAAHVLKHGRGYLLAVVLLAATLLAHLMIGYIALVSLALLLLMRIAAGQWRASVRLAIVLALTALVTSYFFVPFLQDSAYLNRSVWEDATKYSAFGWQWTLSELFKGNLFDFGRLPVLSLLVALGAGVSIARWRDERYRLPLLLFVLWLLLYFGRPTWGSLLDLLPLGHDLQVHRFIAGVHLAGIWLMGIGLAYVWEWAQRANEVRVRIAAVALVALLLAPAYFERTAYMAQSAAWMTQAREALASEARDLDALMDTLGTLPSGRVYAGLGAKWGRDYKVGALPMYTLLSLHGFDMLGYLYHALSLNGDLQVQFDDARAEQYNLFNVRYVLTPRGWSVPSYYQPLQAFGRHQLYEVPTSGYFDLVRADVAFTGSRDEFFPAASAWLHSDLPRLKQHPAVVFGAGGDVPRSFPLKQAAVILPQLATPDGTPRGRIVAERVLSDVYTARVEVQRESMLLLKVSYHPNWRATVDGVETPPQMLMPSYLGVPLSAGVHEVRFAYVPQPQRGELMLMGAAALLLLALYECRPHWIARVVQRVPLRRAAAWLTARVNVTRARRTTPRRTLLGLFFVCLAIYLLSGAGHFFSTDHVAVYLTTQSIVERHSLAIKPIHDAVIGRDGLYYAAFGIGQSLLTIPFYLIGRAVELHGGIWLQQYFGGVPLDDWGGTPSIFFVSLFNQMLSALNVVLFFLLFTRFGLSQRATLMSALVYAFATQVWVYARDSFQHPLEAFCLLASFYILYGYKSSLGARHVLAAGAIFAVGVLTRFNLVFAAPLLAAYVFVLAGASAGKPLLRASSLRLSALYGLPILIALLCYASINFLKFGDVFNAGYNIGGRGFTNPVWVGVYGYLFSTGRSIFLYSPPLLAAALAWPRFVRLYRKEAYLFLAVSALYLLVYSAWWYWDGGWSWGPRFMLPTLPLLLVPLAFWLEARRGTWLVLLLALLGVGVQLLGISVNYSYVHWDWLRMNLTPGKAFLFVPELSPIPTHLQHLLAGRYIDLWLLYVYGEYGLGVFLETLLVPLALLAAGLRLLAAPRATTQDLSFLAHEQRV